MAYTLEVEVMEYCNGRFVASYAGLQECAYTHHIHPSTLKALIYTGNPLPTRSDSVTFDISPDCDYDVVQDEDKAGTRNEYILVRKTAQSDKKGGL